MHGKTLPPGFEFDPVRDIAPEFNDPAQYPQRLMLKVSALEFRVAELERSATWQTKANKRQSRRQVRQRQL